MPTYDYICKDCRHTFELFQSMSDPTVKECPSCNGQVRRLISGGTGLIFKGTGYYVTDYKNRKSSSKEKSETKKDSTKKESTKKEKKD
ncbi:MAG: zinc ribbon domain-containing protein [Candidatus Marinimicrobia bacterium]|nr:zinc ribbon domain-containing protein [Candidatus Neomarinimicrobiota bacterium]MCH7763671.1 zinc ribbon domain-containing protein [Candidatus Neomarinimicrobiota bacterium]